MVIPAFAAIILGLVLGLADFRPDWLLAFTGNTDLMLFALLFLVGLTLGSGNGLRMLKGISKRNLVIVPLGTIAGSLLGGIVCMYITGLPRNISTAIASGMGWYSLSGITMTDLAGATIGSVTFLANFFREIVSFFSIPVIAKHLNYATAIAPAGATSEDTTLSMIIRHTDEETVAISVFNGIVCSAAVPILVGLCFYYL